MLRGGNMSKCCEIELIDSSHRWVIGEEGKYSISENGEIYSYKSKKLLAFCKGKGNAYVVNLSGKSYHIHKLVALTFNNTPIESEIEFMDGNTDNLHFTNLRVKESVFLSRVGNKYGRLRVTDLLTGKGKPKFKCICDCGKEYTGIASAISTGRRLSCGCLKRELTVKRNTIHNLTDSPEYKVWQSMKARCLNVKSKSYNNYGGRGVKVCDEWLEPDGAGFLSFLNDMGFRPSAEDTLDRVNPKGDYCKDNCRWAGRAMQGFNQRKRSTNTSGRTGVFKDIGGWRACIGSKYLGIFKSFDDAVEAREKAELEKFGFIKSGGEYA